MAKTLTGAGEGQAQHGADDGIVPSRVLSPNVSDPLESPTNKVNPAAPLIALLNRAAKGDVEAQRILNAVLCRAALRDSRLDQKPDYRRAQSRFESNRAAERALNAVNRYSRGT